MRNLNLNLVTSNFGAVRVIGVGNGVKVEIDQELRWDREGLQRLSAALAGVAKMLPE